MRIIGGQYKGTRIHIPKTLKARPTTDYARESLFNILSNRYDLDQCAFLDLFSGSGLVSFEMVSRGCKHVSLVENHPVNFKFIKSVVQKYNFPIQCYRQDVFKALPRLQERFDLIFADPPYDLYKISDIPSFVMNNEVLKKEGIFILEHGKRDNFEGHENFFEMRKYSAVHLSFFKPV